MAARLALLRFSGPTPAVADPRSGAEGISVSTRSPASVVNAMELHSDEKIPLELNAGDRRRMANPVSPIEFKRGVQKMVNNPDRVAMLAAYDQADATIRNVIQDMVNLFRAIKKENPNQIQAQIDAQAKLMVGLSMISPEKTMLLAITAITMLAEKED